MTGFRLVFLFIIGSPGKLLLIGFSEANIADLYLIARTTPKIKPQEIARLPPISDYPAQIKGKGGPAFPNTKLTAQALRSEEHTSELQSLMRTSYAVFCLNK